jgi:hypothetical protein
MLYEVFDVESLLKFEFYADHSRHEFDMIIETAMRLGTCLNLF